MVSNYAWPMQRSKFMLGAVALENQNLQNALICCVQSKNSASGNSFMMQGDQIALDLGLGWFLDTQLLEKHEMRIAAHEVQDLIMTRGKQRVPNTNRVLESQLASFFDPIAIKSGIKKRAADQQKCQNFRD